MWEKFFVKNFAATRLKISVLAKPNSKKEGVEISPEGVYIVRVHVVPEDGKANERVRELLADHFDIAKSKVQLVSGSKGKHKIFEVDQ